MKNDDMHDEFAHEGTLSYNSYNASHQSHNKKKKKKKASSFSIMLFSVSFLIIILAVLSMYGIITNSSPSWSRGMGSVSEERLVGVKRGFLNKATDKEMADKEKRRMKDAAAIDIFADDLEKQERAIIKANEEKMARKLSAELVGRSIDTTINRVNMAGLYDGETVLGEIAKDLHRPREEVRDIYIFTNKASDYKAVKTAYGGNDVIIAIEVFERREQISRLINQLE